LAGENEVNGEYLPQCRFVHHKPQMLFPDANPDRCGGKPATNPLSYGTAETKITINMMMEMLVIIPKHYDVFIINVWVVFL
jgi:hypothetical protein